MLSAFPNAIFIVRPKSAPGAFYTAQGPPQHSEILTFRAPDPRFPRYPPASKCYIFSELKDLPETTRRPQEAPKRTQEGTRRPQEAQGSTQEGPRRTQEAPDIFWKAFNMPYFFSTKGSPRGFLEFHNRMNTFFGNFKIA